MYTIERREFGYLLTFSGDLVKEEWQRWYEESVAKLLAAPPSFGVIVDMRELTPPSSNRQLTMVKGQQLYRDKGMLRSAVILNNAVLAYQTKQAAQHSGIYSFERYINVETHNDWFQVAKGWVDRGIDPDA